MKAIEGMILHEGSKGGGYYTTRDNKIGRHVAVMKLGKKWRASIREQNGTVIIEGDEARTIRDAIKFLGMSCRVSSGFLDRNPFESWM